MSDATVTPKQINLLHHALGLRPDRREPYRNHFVAGPGHHDQSDLEALEAAGLMERTRSPSFLDDGDVAFRCTAAGRAFALDHLPPEPPRTKYDDYLHSESCDGFGAFLGIRVPKIETTGFGRYGEPTRYRMYREQWDAWDHSTYRDVQGDWKPTKKEAKASYKAALRRSNDNTLPAVPA